MREAIEDDSSGRLVVPSIGWVAAVSVLLVLAALAVAVAGEDEALLDPPAAACVGDGCAPPAEAPVAAGEPAPVVPPTRDESPVHRDGSLIANYVDQIDVPAGQSAIVRLRRAAQRVAIADPEVADVVLVSPTEILINGRGRRYQANTGETIIQEAQTSLIVWDRDGVADVRGLYVNRARKEQVELGVTVAEVNRTAIENQGFDFQVFQGQVFVQGTPAKIASISQFVNTLTSPVPGGPKTITTPTNVNPDRLTFSVIDLGNNFAAFIELLQRESMAKVLARPTLLSRSGEEAHFRSGGEVPIPLVTNNQLAVQFKEFGVIVNFTPTFTDDGGIDLRVTAELSAPDPTLSGVQSGGFTVPAFRSRQASTRVRLREGQSLVIAGLLRDDEVEEEQKVPYIGDVPFLGAFFRRTSFNRTKSELLVLVQPRVARERDDTGVALPTARGPLTRGEVRTKPEVHEVSRPRLLGKHGAQPEP
jgi:Flp pilus assembly secretin CpaC